MNAADQTRATLELALKLAWQGVKDEILVEQFHIVEQELPRGIILADKQTLWKNMIVKKFAIMNELAERFGNAQQQ